MDFDIESTLSNEDETKKTLIEHREDVVNVLGSIANNRRMEILTSLLEGQHTFKTLQEKSGLGKTALSHHLSILVETGMIEQKSRGVYELSRDGLDMLGAVSESYYESVRMRERLTVRRADYLRRMHTRNTDMSKLEVRIERLEPMRVVSFHAVGESPENDAVEKLIAWAQPRGLLDNPDEHPVYGFNNPNPQEGKKEYGYEFWIKVDEDHRDESAVYKEYSGGKYAVTRVEVKDPWEDIPKAWMNLLNWVKEKGITMRHDLCLEKTLDPGATGGEFILDLMLPIEE